VKPGNGGEWKKSEQRDKRRVFHGIVERATGARWVRFGGCTKGHSWKISLGRPEAKAAAVYGPVKLAWLRGAASGKLAAA
jgi:hypothetical protein